MPDDRPPSGATPEGTPGHDPSPSGGLGSSGSGGPAGQRGSDLTGMSPAVSRSGPGGGSGASAAAGAAPPVYSRQELRAMAKEGTPSRTRWYVLAGVAVVLIGVVAAYVATRGDDNTTVQKAAVVATTVP